jgi:hypothetical protein
MRRPTYLLIPSPATLPYCLFQSSGHFLDVKDRGTTVVLFSPVSGDANAYQRQVITLEQLCTQHIRLSGWLFSNNYSKRCYAIRHGLDGFSEGTLKAATSVSADGGEHYIVQYTPAPLLARSTAVLHKQAARRVGGSLADEGWQPKRACVLL